MPRDLPAAPANARRRAHPARPARPAPFSAALARPDVDVGQRLRELRTQRRLSIRALAQKSGLNPNTLSLIENGKTSPSVATLQQAAVALDVHIAAFFETSADTSRVTFQKRAQRFGVPFEHGWLEDLGAGIARRGIEPFLVILEPNADSGPTPIVHTGRELVYCLEGRLAYTVAGQTYMLEAGDSLLFEAYLPHRWENAGDTVARSLLILCPADERDQPTERHFSGGRRA
jgi:transcriptional regulator with XRE-family HTH domain